MNLLCLKDLEIRLHGRLPKGGHFFRAENALKALATVGLRERFHAPIRMERVDGFIRNGAGLGGTHGVFEFSIAARGLWAARILAVSNFAFRSKVSSPFFS